MHGAWSRTFTRESQLGGPQRVVLRQAVVECWSFRLLPPPLTEYVCRALSAIEFLNSSPNRASQKFEVFQVKKPTKTKPKHNPSEKGSRQSKSTARQPRRRDHLASRPRPMGTRPKHTQDSNAKNANAPQHKAATRHKRHQHHADAPAALPRHASQPANSHERPPTAHEPPALPKLEFQKMLSSRSSATTTTVCPRLSRSSADRSARLPDVATVHKLLTTGRFRTSS